MSSPITTGRVLVVDDNRDAADSMSQVLSMSGFEVETCYDGLTALAIAATARPDACVLDISMPGMTGYELARRLREMFPTRPPVFATMTAYGDHDHLERAVSAGFDLHFTKPADPAEVAEQLQECVRRAATHTFPEGPARVEGRKSLARRLLDRVGEMLPRPRTTPGWA